MRVVEVVNVYGFPGGEFHAWIDNDCAPLGNFVVSTDVLKAPLAEGVAAASPLPLYDISTFR
jgi:hypothetical protein